MTMIPVRAIADPADLRYPVGRHRRFGAISAEERAAAVKEIAALPANLAQAIAGLSQEQLDTPYREGGWTVRQLVHHIADSHMQAFLRVRLALTETDPTIKPYDEKLWAELADTKTAPVALSVALLTALHSRWTTMLRSLAEEQWQRRYLHPENGPTTVDEAAQLYAWHSRHHVAHITRLRAARDW